MLNAFTANRAANESSSSELELAQLNSYENSSELKLSEIHDRAVEHDSCSACTISSRSRASFELNEMVKIYKSMDVKQKN